MGLESGNASVLLINELISAIGNLQKAVEPIIDTELGYKMFGYKTDDIAYKLLAKDMPGKLSSLLLNTGATVNEFSTDATLADNSDNKVSTQKALKTFITTNSVWITEEATGDAVLFLDGIEHTRIKTSGQMLSGTTTAPTDVNTRQVIYSSGEGAYTLYQTEQSGVGDGVGALIGYSNGEGIRICNYQYGGISFATLGVTRVSILPNGIFSVAGTANFNGAVAIAGSLKFSTGAVINEVSTDGTFSAVSDNQLATTLATKTYVDSTYSVGSGVETFPVVLASQQNPIDQTPYYVRYVHSGGPLTVTHMSADCITTTGGTRNVQLGIYDINKNRLGFCSVSVSTGGVFSGVLDNAVALVGGSEYYFALLELGGDAGSFIASSMDISRSADFCFLGATGATGLPLSEGTASAVTFGFYMGAHRL